MEELQGEEAELERHLLPQDTQQALPHLPRLLPPAGHVAHIAMLLCRTQGLSHGVRLIATQPSLGPLHAVLLLLQGPATELQ